MNQDDVPWFEHDELTRPQGPFCAECGAVWKMGYAYLSAEACVASYASTPEFQMCFDSSKEVLAGTTKLASLPGSVAAATDCGYRIERRFFAFTKKKFRERYQVDPEQVQHKPVELRDEFGDVFNTYLVCADDDSHCQVVIYYNQSNTCAVIHQRPETTLHDQQLSQTYKALTGDSKPSMLRKANKALSDEVIQAKAREVLTAQGLRFNPPLPLVSGGLNPKPSLDSDVFDGASRGSISPREAPRGSASDGGATPLAPGAPSAAAANAGMMWRIPTIGRLSSRGSMVDELGGRDGPAKTVTDHIARLPLSSIIAGAKLGVARRWADAFVVKNPTDPSVDLLKSHLRAVKSCEELCSAGASQLSEEDLNGHLKEVEQHEVDLPTDVKLMLLQRRVDQWLARSDRFASVPEVLALIVPWTELGDSGDIPSFDPAAPAMACIEGSPAEKCLRFNETMVHSILIPTMKVGEKKLSEAIQLCSSVVSALEAVTDIADEYAECMLGLLNLFRLVWSVASGVYVEGCSAEDLQAMEKSISDKTPRNYMGVVAAVMVEVPLYKEKKQDLKKFALATARLKPRVQRSIEELAAASSNIGVNSLMGHLDMLNEVDGKVAPSVADALRESLVSAVREFAQKSMRDIADKPMSTEDLEGVVQFGQKANEALGRTDGVEQLISIARERQHMDARRSKIDTFAEACDDATLALYTFGVLMEEPVRDRLQGLAVELRGVKVSEPNEQIGAFLGLLLGKLLTTEDPTTVVDAADLVAELVGLCAHCPRVSVEGIKELLVTSALFEAASIALNLLKGVATMPVTPDTDITDKEYLDLSTSHAMFYSRLASFPEHKSVPFFHAASEHFDKWMRAVSTTRIAREEKLVAAKTEQLKPLALGDAGERSWRKDLPDTASLMDLHAKAVDTLLRGPGALISSCCEDLSKGLDRLKDLGEMHSVSNEVKQSPVYTDGRDVLRKARATMAEAFILKKVYDDRANPLKVKKHMDNFTRKAEAWDCSELLHPAFAAAHELAKKFKLKLW